TLGFAGALRLIARAAGVELSEVCWYASIFFPAFYAFYNRQDVPLLLLVSAAAYFLLARRRHSAAGLVLALCTIKFHLLLLIPLALVGGKNWRALRAFVIGAAALVLVSVLIVGPSGVGDYATMLFHGTPKNMDFPERIVNLSKLVRDSWVR